MGEATIPFPMVIAGPIIRLGLLLALLVHPGVAAEPTQRVSRHVDIRIGCIPGDQSHPAGTELLFVNSKPFIPIGVSYHFTQCRDSWDEDLQAMHNLGLNTVRIDLSWRDVAPIIPGHYHFSLLDNFLDLASKHGLYVIPVFSHTTQEFNTPLWFWAIYRDWRVVDQDGHVPLDDLPSVNHPVYRKLLRDYIEATVRHIKDHPAVLACQLLNEPRYDPKRLYD